MPTVNFQAPTEYSVESADIDRRRKMAELLQQQALEPIHQQPTPAGGFAVPISWTQGLAKALQGYAAGRAQDRASEQQKALGERYNTERAAALSAALQAGQGTPAQTVQQPVDTAQEGTGSMDMSGSAGPETQPVQKAAVPGSRQAMIAMLTGSKFPDLQQAGLAQTLKEQEPYTLAPGATRYGAGGQPIVTAPVKAEPFTLAPGATRFGPDNKPIAAMPKDDELARALEAAGVDLKSPEAAALFQARAEKIATHAPPTRVNVAQNVSTEKKYGEKFAGEIAQSDSAARDAAMKAPQLADRANQIKQILSKGNVITGFGADFRLQADKALALAGVKSADGTAANTETLASGLAQNTLDAIKASGLGSGNGFSNADRDFLEKAVGGKINLQKDTIDRLANLAHRAADQTAKRWSTRVKEIPASALEGTGIKTDPVQVAPLFGTQPQNPDAPPPGAVRRIQ